MNNSYFGSCHCQNIKFEFHSELDFSDFRPRACDCDFCRKHCASYVSDPRGTLQIKILKTNQISHYQHGSKTAEFLVCRNCGVFVAVIYTEEETIYAGINSNTVQDNSQFGEPKIVSPKKLEKEAKIDRWKEIWFSNVTIKNHL